MCSNDIKANTGIFDALTEEIMADPFWARLKEELDLTEGELALLAVSLVLLMVVSFI